MAPSASVAQSVSDPMVNIAHFSKTLTDEMLGMAAPRRLPVCRLGYGLVFNGMHPAFCPGCSGWSPDRGPLIDSLPTHDATNNYFLPAFWGAFYRSPIRHSPAWMLKFVIWEK
jgi:hypothetical protein